MAIYTMPFTDRKGQRLFSKLTTALFTCRLHDPEKDNAFDLRRHDLRNLVRFSKYMHIDKYTYLRCWQIKLVWNMTALD